MQIVQSALQVRNEATLRNRPIFQCKHSMGIFISSHFAHKQPIQIQI